MSSLANILILMISILVCVAFYTLIERKVLSYIQIRKGPNKTSLTGILQPFSDAIKLFNKSMKFPSHSNYTLMLLGPTWAMMTALLLLTFLPNSATPLYDNHFNALSYILVSSIMVYPIILTGWASNSKYSNLGTIRNIAQMISYEVNLFLIILLLLLLLHSYSLIPIIMKHFTWIAPGSLIILLMWSVACLAEVNRSPYDFAEGESELVSGFNVEFMGTPFAMIFLAEYMNMIILSLLSTALFSFNSIPILILFFFMFLWMRGTLPRYRFDLLMYMNWMMILPITLMIFPLHLNITAKFF